MVNIRDLDFFLATLMLPVFTVIAGTVLGCLSWLLTKPVSIRHGIYRGITWVTLAISGTALAIELIVRTSDSDIRNSETHGFMYTSFVVFAIVFIVTCVVTEIKNRPVLSERHRFFRHILPGTLVAISYILFNNLNIFN